MHEWLIKELKEKGYIFKTQSFQETCGETKRAFFIPFTGGAAQKSRPDQMKHTSTCRNEKQNNRATHQRAGDSDFIESPRSDGVYFTLGPAKG